MYCRRNVHAEFVLFTTYSNMHQFNIWQNLKKKLKVNKPVTL